MSEGRTKISPEQFNTEQQQFLEELNRIAGHHPPRRIPELSNLALSGSNFLYQDLSNNPVRQRLDAAKVQEGIRAVWYGIQGRQMSAANIINNLDAWLDGKNLRAVSHDFISKVAEIRTSWTADAINNSECLFPTSQLSFPKVAAMLEFIAQHAAEQEGQAALSEEEQAVYFLAATIARTVAGDLALVVTDRGSLDTDKTIELLETPLNKAGISLRRLI